MRRYIIAHPPRTVGNRVSTKQQTWVIYSNNVDDVELVSDAASERCQKLKNESVVRVLVQEKCAETARDDLEVELATARSDRPAESDRRMTQKLAAAEKARRAADKRLAQSESARRDSEATLRRSLNAALAAVADRDRALAARERELRDLRSAQLPPEPVPLRDLSEIADPVESFLEAVGLGHHLAIFKREEIDIDTLRDIDTGDLVYLGLSDDECRRFEDARNANF